METWLKEKEKKKKQQGLKVFFKKISLSLQLLWGN